ncbi:MAG: SusC/RagA family TonB-linked outer membrane protein [Daejeonella sp.]|nr:SusC/RagA family TonB-linked outer membrane protein [Daejeonella sp.]
MTKNLFFLYGYCRKKFFPLKKLLETPVTCLTIVFLLLSQGASAQSTVSGTVTDDAGVTLIGVSVKLKNTQAGASTNGAGAFSLSVPDVNTGVLVFTYVGFETQEVAINGKSSVNVKLKASSTSLNEVVVVGYGTQLKRDLTGAVSVVKASDIQKRQATTVAEAMQGLATGINVRGGGQPGSEAQIAIRGLKNMSSVNPLYVIDGLITTANRDFNPNDIESIQILKDASAAAIYGSRAANGVIIITTKKGKSGPMKVDFSGKASTQAIPTYDLAGTDEFSKLNFMAYDNAGVPRQNLALTTNTDWQKEAFRTGNIQDYNLSFSGGSENGTYLVSGNYFGNKGTVISTGFERLSFRVNSQGSKGIFSIGENIAITNSTADEISGNPIVDVIRLLPTIPVYDPANPGGFGYGNESKARTFGTNPVAIANLQDRTNENMRLRGNLWSELKILPSLKYRVNLGYETSNDHYAFLRQQGNWTLNQAFDPSIANENRGRSQTKLVENTLTFNKKFNQHSINVIGGQSFQQDNYSQINGTKRNLLPNPLGGYYDVLDQGSEPQTGGFKSQSNLLSYFARAEYNYGDRYLINGVIRRDGTSKFGGDNKWGNYPSVSAAWRISNEKFFKVSWIDDLKARASYGTLGSSNIGPYDYIALVNTFSTIAMGRDQHIESGAAQVQLANSNLHWEKLIQQNYGIDAAFLNNKLSITAEYFDARTEDVLFGFPIAITTGNDGGNPRVNGITLGNKGFEFSTTYRDETKAFKYYATANLTKLNNKVIKLGYNNNNTYAGNTVTEVGQPVGMWYVLQTDGLFQNATEVSNYKNAEGKVIQPGAQPGDIRFRDNNGDGQITNQDKAVVGSPWPDMELGLNLGASYKGFELSMNWFGSFGATVFNGPRSVMERFDDNSNYPAGVQPWTAQNPNTTVPRAYYGTTLNSRGDTERWLEDGSFMRLKYVSLAYTIPNKLINRLGVANAQLSLSGQNLFTFTKYKGLDPEFNNSSIFERGFDYGAFPNVRMVSFGLQLGF